MPNPLTRIGAKPSKTNIDRPVALKPVIEHVEGANFPYRGPYDHGVEPTEKPRDPEMYGMMEVGKEVGLIEPEKDPEPIPVRVVQEYKRELRRFGSDRMVLDFTNANNPAQRPVEVLGRSEQRSVVRILNLDAANWLLVGNSREEVLQRGYPLGPGKELASTSEDPFFVLGVTPAFATLNATIGLAYYTEYRIKEE